MLIGTRKSKLALWQTGHVAGLIEQAVDGVKCEQVTFETVGDLTLDKPLPEIGGKGLFTQELEDALRSKRIDLAMHSLKDLPTEDVPGLTIGAICERVDPRDILVSANYASLAELPEGAVVGTSSTRRIAQLLAARPDVTTRSIRGNVDTRIKKAKTGDYDAILLASAGVTRLDLTNEITEYLPFETMLPAPGQGAIAVQCRANDASVLETLALIDHTETRIAVTAERAFLKRLGGGCSTPVAAYATVDGDEVNLTGLVAAVDGKTIIRVEATGNIGSEVDVGLTAAEDALVQGAQELLQ